MIQCRACLEFSFVDNECINCGLYICKPYKPTNKIKYFEKLLREHKQTIGPNQYVYGFDSKIHNELVEKYNQFLEYMYKIRPYRYIRHKYYLNMLLNEHKNFDEIWDNFLDCYERPNEIIITLDKCNIDYTIPNLRSIV